MFQVLAVTRTSNCANDADQSSRRVSSITVLPMLHLPWMRPLAPISRLPTACTTGMLSDIALSLVAANRCEKPLLRTMLLAMRSCRSGSTMVRSDSTMGRSTYGSIVSETAQWQKMLRPAMPHPKLLLACQAINTGNMSIAYRCDKSPRSSCHRRFATLSGRQLGEGFGDAQQRRAPIAISFLPKDSHRRIPWRALRTQPPPPACVVPVDEPGRLAQ